MNFSTYCEENGIKLLKNDIDLIKSQLKLIKHSERKEVMHRYTEIWLKGMQITDIVYKHQNIGRRLANTYLRNKANPVA